MVMARLSAVPGWVCRPLIAVAGVEDFLLRLFGRTQAPQVLGSRTSLAWLGAEDGELTPGPLIRCGLPVEDQAWADALVANAIADGGPYPPSSWWLERNIAPADRLTPRQWAERAGDPYERLYAHGAAAALGWVLGTVTDAGLMTPIRGGDGAPIPAADQDVYRAELRRLAAIEQHHRVGRLDTAG